MTASIDCDGKLWIDHVADVPIWDAVATFTFRSDPDWLADEIRFEAKARKML